MARRSLLVWLMLAVSVSIVFARDADGGDNTDENPGPSAEGSEARREQDEETRRATARRILLVNSLIPGYAQWRSGDRSAAIGYAMSLPLQALGLGMTSYVMGERLGGVDFSLDRAEGRTSFGRYRAEPGPVDEWLLFAGTTASLYGTLLAAYSQYAAFYDFRDRGLVQPDAGTESGDPDSLGSILAAPFRIGYIVDPLVLPVLLMSTLQSVGHHDLSAVREYFARDRVDFGGVSVCPVGGLLLRAVTACALVVPNAAWEEIAYRGISLANNGVLYSSLTFGAAHLPNMLMPGATVEGTILQSVFATAFGFYAAEVVRGDGYHLHRAVALHFWNNMLAWVLEFLTNPDAPVGITLEWRYIPGA